VATSHARQRFRGAIECCPSPRVLSFIGSHSLLDARLVPDLLAKLFVKGADIREGLNRTGFNQIVRKDKYTWPSA